MTELEKIDYMISSLQVARDEILYAEKYMKASKTDDDSYSCENYNGYYRYPNGTIIRESLRQVGRMANMVARDVTLTPYCTDIFRNK